MKPRQVLSLAKDMQKHYAAFSEVEEFLTELNAVSDKLPGLQMKKDALEKAVEGEGIRLRDTREKLLQLTADVEKQRKEILFNANVARTAANKAEKDLRESHKGIEDAFQGMHEKRVDAATRQLGILTTKKQDLEKAIGSLEKVKSRLHEALSQAAA